MNIRALVAEFIGTFALIFIGAGAVITTGNIVAVAFAHGLVVVVFAYAYGHISGTHINPAVTLGMLVAGEVNITTATGYWVVQLLGGAAGGFALQFVLGSTGDIAGGMTTLAGGVTMAGGFAIELILTFFMMNTILNAAVSGKAGNLAGLAIGMTLTLSILMAGPLTGASLNPARTFGPALAAGDLSLFPLYLAATAAGAVLAALLYRLMLKP